MSSTRIDYVLKIASEEVFTTTELPASTTDSGRTVSGGFASENRHTSSTTPAVEKPACHLTITIGASAEILDLTAIDVGISRTDDFTGKKLISYAFRTASGNAGAVTVDAHSTNGYNVFGASGLLKLVPGRHVASTIAGVASQEVAVAAGAKNIRIDGTQNDVVDVTLTFGT